MFTFAQAPTQADFKRLVEHLKNAEQSQMHPSLWRQRAQVAGSLQKMSPQPELPAHQQAYHALRLLLW